MQQSKRGPAAPSAEQADACAAAIRGWLLSPAVQRREDPHAGAVVGAHDAAGRARYVYPEITGYYLHWLGDVHEVVDRNQARDAAAHAAGWTWRQFADGRIPATRAYLVDEEPDWRNGASFFFDVAMLLRGLCAAAEAQLITVSASALQPIVAELQRFVSADGALHAARAVRPGANLPDRWSTWGGPFEVKASSRVVLAAHHVDIGSSLRAACEREADRHAADTAAVALDMLHPTLYFAEGMLVARPSLAPQVGVLLQRCLRLQRSDGSLPEAELGADTPRSDIIAQALRIGLLLRDGSVAGAPADEALHALAAALIDRVAADGSVCFRNDVAAQRNVWCSLFAEQALRWHARWSRGLNLPAAKWLV